MKNKIKLFLLIGLLVVCSFFISNIRVIFLDIFNSVIVFVDNIRQDTENKISEHFNHVEEIKDLRKQNVELEHLATLSTTFAYELNTILSDKNSATYEPNVLLTKALSYVNIGDYNKIWMDFKDFNTSKIYGLLHHGKTAGIIISKDNRPLGLLQTDPDCVFSVYIGENKIAGIATGNYKNIEIKYIYQWTNPKIGDEVYTSGLDGIFFGGVPVGKITEIKEQDLYKSAIVEPDNTIEVPSYLYVITKTR